MADLKVRCESIHPYRKVRTQCSGTEGHEHGSHFVFLPPLQEGFADKLVLEWFDLAPVIVEGK